MIYEKYEKQLDECEKFWERTNTARPIMYMSYKVPTESYYPAPKDLEQKWLDDQYVREAFKQNSLQKTGYLAEGIPTHFVNFGPGCLAACIGGGYDLAPNTIWFDRDPIIKDWDNMPEIRFDENSDMWRRIVSRTQTMAADPEIHFTMTDIGGIMDVVASLRGTENLLYDLYDYPEAVKELSAKVKECWFEAFDRSVEMIRDAGQPFNQWMLLPSKKPQYPLQCDFCYMISPSAFEEFVLPDIVDQTRHMERSIYHLDGVGELPHLDMLLDIPELTGIQWSPGDGQPRMWDGKWFDIYRKIQDKKKNLVLLGGINECDMAGAERLIKSIDPTGVYMTVFCSSRESAEDMLEKVTRWCE